MDNIDVYGLEDIAKPIKNRLLDWARKKNPLPPEMMRYTQERIREFEGEEVSDELIEGWQCGLGQMLDLGNEVFYSVLPYALTAYMYNCNRPKNRFISDFLCCILREHKGDDFTSEAYLGIAGKFQEDEKTGAAQTGFGKLLLGEYVINSNGAKRPLENLSRYFTVSDVSLRIMPSVAKASMENFKIVPNDYGGKAFEKRREQIIAKNKRIKSSDLDELPEETDDAGEGGRFIYVQKPMNIRNEIETISSDLEFLSQTGHPSREQLKRFARVEYDLNGLNAEVDAIKKQVEDLGGKCKALRHGVYSKARLDDGDSVPGYYPDYKTFVNIFVTWYHIWCEAEKGGGVSGWKPAYKIDPIQCTLLFAKSFWASERYEEFKMWAEESASESEDELQRNMDQYLKEKYKILSEGGFFDFLDNYQPLTVLCLNRR